MRKYKVIWQQRMNGATSVYVDEHEAASAGCALAKWGRTPWCNARVIGVVEEGCLDAVLNALTARGRAERDATAKILD